MTALKSDPLTLSNELVSENLIPPLDGQVSAQKLAELLLRKIEVTPKRYYDVINVFSRHDWLKDIVEILQLESNDCEIKINVLGINLLSFVHGTRQVVKLLKGTI